jgi:hypothetical protein
MAQTGKNDFSVLWNVSSKIKILRPDYILQQKDLLKGKFRTEILNNGPISGESDSAGRSDVFE